MREKGNITIYQKLLKSRMFFIFLAPIFFALIIIVFQKFYYRYESSKEFNKLSAELNNLNREKKELNDLLDSYKNESNIEKEARIRLNLKKVGEKVVIILPAATSTGGSGEAISGSASDSRSLPNYTQWWYYFFGK